MQNYAGDGSYPTTIPIVDDSENYQSAAPFAVGFEALADRTSAIYAHAQQTKWPIFNVVYFGDSTIRNFAMDASPNNACLALVNSPSSPFRYTLTTIALESGDVVDIAMSVPFIAWNVTGSSLSARAQVTADLYAPNTETMVTLTCTHAWQTLETAEVAKGRGLDRVSLYAMATIAVSDSYQLALTGHSVMSWKESDDSTTTRTTEIAGLQLWSPYDGIIRVYRGLI